MPRRVYTYPSELGWDAWNLVSTLGSYLLGIGLLLVLAGIVHAVRRGRPASNDPWGGDTLEWSTASPPEPYNFAVLPRVRSLHPTWDEHSAESTGEAATADRILSEGRRTLLTSELDARYERAVDMPEVSLQPLVIALALLVFFAAMLFAWYAVAGVAGAVVAATIAVWLWPPRRPPADVGTAA
jgi:cytochrome c oxidase subunit I+III